MNYNKMAESFTPSLQESSSTTASPTEVNSPTFGKIFPTVNFEGPEDDLSSKLMLFTIFRLLQRIESQLDGQDSRLSSVESSIRMRADSLDGIRYQRPHLPEVPLRERWGNVVSEYERSIMKLRRNYVEDGTPDPGVNPARLDIGRASDNQHVDVADMHTQSLGVGCRDGDAYSVSVYSGNILEKAMEQDQPSHVRPTDDDSSTHHTIPSIKYEADGIVHCNNPTELGNTPCSDDTSRSQSGRTFKRSQQLLETTVELLDTWTLALASRIGSMKGRLRKDGVYHSKITSQRLQETMERTYSILDTWRTGLVSKLKSRNKERLKQKTQKSRPLTNERLNKAEGYVGTMFNSSSRGSPHFSSANLPRKMLSSFG